MITINCAACKEEFGLNDVTYKTLERSQTSFCCPWGHNNYFPAGETESDSLRRERDRLKQDAARLNDWLKSEKDARQRAERRVSAAKGRISRMKNRTAEGRCPCCARVFVDLRSHMKSKHDGYVAEEIDLDAAEPEPAETAA